MPIFKSYQDELAQLAHLFAGGMITGCVGAASHHLLVGLLSALLFAAGKEFGRDYWYAKVQSFKDAARDFAFFSFGVWVMFGFLFTSIRM